ncbi:MAG TPA: hypothetical protein DC000_03475 [Clostridiales bacterium]|nr:hypothetical protein [Clostridiales bacterium]
MFIVVQEVALKKQNTYGTSKYIETSQMTFTIGEVTKTKNYHSNSSERFERPIKKAYKISIHKSYRESGKVRKQQRVIATVDYYTLIDFWIGDCLIHSRIEDIAKCFSVSSDELYNMIYEKIEPLSEHINKEFETTEEYHARVEQRNIIDIYMKAKDSFAKKYNVDSDEYDYCYNVFGELTNEEYLNKIKEQYKQKSSYYEDFFNNYSKGSYSNNSYSNYNSSSYFNLKQNNYTEDEKKKLNSFYKVLAKKFHPDLNPGNDTTEEMQLLNKLKEDWSL